MFKSTFSCLSRRTAFVVLGAFALTACDKHRAGDNPPEPTVSLAVGDVTSDTSLEFRITLIHADKCTYVCTESTEEQPSPDYILTNGESVTESGTVTIDHLAPNTTYRLSAIASKGKTVGKVTTLQETTSAPDVHPAVVLNIGTAAETSLTFSATLTDSQTAAYVCLEKSAEMTIPTAEAIISEGRPIDESGEIEVEGLIEGTTYVIAAAVVHTGIYSEVTRIEMTTREAPEGPIAFTRQAAGGYYGVPSGFRYGRYLVVLADGETSLSGGVYSTTGPGRALSIDLNSLAPTTIASIPMPEGTFSYATTRERNTLHPDATFCMVNDGENVTRVEFSAGTIEVTKVGSTYTFAIALTTTDGEEFNATYSGPAVIENKTGGGIEKLPELEKDVKNVKFVRALAKYYNPGRRVRSVRGESL